MPELPEVETVVRDLRDALSGRRIEGAVLDRGSVVRFPDGVAFTARLHGASIGTVGRRGKYILVSLDAGPRVPAGADGEPPDVLVVHLGMTGHLDVVEAGAPDRPHTHLRVRLDDGRELRFADARRFGRLLLGPLDALVAARAMPRLGVEPLSPAFTPAVLDGLLRRTTRTVKAALLDQTGVAGLGNIYVDEACHLAGVRPQRRSHRTTRAERHRLHGAVVTVLEKGIRNRGTTIDDYRDVWDATGRNQEELRAYGRGGLPCLVCATPMRHAVVAGRGTTWCPQCQR